jgi:DNA polymerase-1
MGISAFGITGYEADDLIGTIVNKMKARKEWEVGIVTGDKDALQLLNGHVFVYFPSRGRIGAQRIDSKKFIEKYGFAPENLVDFKALAGDPSDDIPGVAGVGQKTAEVLIKEFAEVEKVYESLDKIPERVRTKLEKSRELAFLSKELARIDRNVPLKFELEDCHFELGHLAHVKELFKELNFSSLIRRVDGMIGTLNKVSGEVKESNKIEQMSFF